MQSPVENKTKGIRRETDVTLAWVAREYPQLAEWRDLAIAWLRGETRGLSGRLQALSAFFDKYLFQLDLPTDPAALLARGSILPDFYETVCADSSGGVRYNNYIHAFLDYVLLQAFSLPADDGQPVVSPAYRNPVSIRSRAGMPHYDESVRSPLPYGYIDELRRILAAGPNFGDWHWAHNALGGKGISGKRQVSTCWFPVTEQEIDKEDPDCVWREKPLYGGKTRLEMWSPVRWVALLIKLILPLRTLQVRLLDSGEADFWRYEAENWVHNSHSLAKKCGRHIHQQGVFRRVPLSSETDSVSTYLYINTNKTHDIGKAGPDKGYIMPWTNQGELHEQAFFWLEKLRNWQEKYNPIVQRTSWTELDGRHIAAKSDVQLAGYPETCFLFRQREARRDEQHLPISQQSLNICWSRLLGALETRLAARGETHSNGMLIQLLPDINDRSVVQTTLFPLHSLRVSLITALALDGQVPFPILQKLVGHSRLLMTLYYTKPGATHIRDALIGAAEQLDANKDASIQNFLLDTEHAQLLQQAICHSIPSLAMAIPQHPAARNPAGWMHLHHGLCLVGGNTSDIEGNSNIGGCFNGGPNLGSVTTPNYGPVPGGSRNCVRCRWFVTEPHYLPALAAQFNNIAYHFDEARNNCLSRDGDLQALKKSRIDAEQAGLPFPKIEALRQAERIWEIAMKQFSDLAEDLVACHRLIDRCQSAMENTSNNGTYMVAAGTISDVNLVFEETESELLQLAGVCENAELYPDLNPGKAVFRRSQLLDSMLYRDKLSPVFMQLSEQEQLRVGNAFMNHLARQVNPNHSILGTRELICAMDAGKKLSEHLGVDLSALIPSAVTTTSSVPIDITLWDIIDGK